MNMWLWICTQYPLLNRYTSIAGIRTNIWLWSFPVECQMDAKDSREQQTVDSQRRLELLKSIQGGHTNGFPLFFGPSIIPVIPFVSWWSVISERSPAPALLVVHIQLQDGIGAGCEEISRRRHHLIHLSAVQWTPSSGSISCVFFPGFQKSMAWFERKLWCLDMFCLVSKTEGLLSIFSAPPNLGCKSWWFCYSRLPRTKIFQKSTILITHWALPEPGSWLAAAAAGATAECSATQPRPPPSPAGFMVGFTMHHGNLYQGDFEY